MEANLFKHWRSMAIEAMVSAGSRTITVNWGTEDRVRQLIVRQMRETRIEDPEDTIMPEGAYARTHGDWRTNGKGHKYVDWGASRES